MADRVQQQQCTRERLYMYRTRVYGAWYPSLLYLLYFVREVLKIILGDFTRTMWRKINARVVLV